jgi:hypothetical protein
MSALYGYATALREEQAFQAKVNARVEANEIPGRPNETGTPVGDVTSGGFFHHTQGLYAVDPMGDNAGYKAAEDAVRAALQLSSDGRPALAVIGNDAGRYYLSTVAAGFPNEKAPLQISDQTPAAQRPQFFEDDQKTLAMVDNDFILANPIHPSIQQVVDAQAAGRLP